MLPAVPLLLSAAAAERGVAWAAEKALVAPGWCCWKPGSLEVRAAGLEWGSSASITRICSVRVLITLCAVTWTYWDECVRTEGAPRTC